MPLVFLTVAPQHFRRSQHEWIDLAQRESA